MKPVLERVGMSMRTRSTSLGPALVLFLVFLLAAPALLAQEPGPPAASHSETIRLLLQRVAELEAKVKKIDQLEARVKQLEDEKLSTASAPAAPVAAHTSAAPEKESELQEEPPVPERMDVSKTLLRIRGFGDINLHGDNKKGDTTSFTLGQLNLFVTSDISERFKVLSEIIFEGGPDNIYGVTTGQRNTFGVDVERSLIEYSHNDYFKLAAGRWHTAIGYYNTAYHHSTWLQPPTDRPSLSNFEIRDGFLPLPGVGWSASDWFRPGRLRCPYWVEG